MILLANTLWLCVMIWAGTPVGTIDPGENRTHASAQPNTQQDAMSVMAASLTKYYVGVARRGPNWTAAAINELDDVTKANRVYLADLVAAQKLVGAGRVLEGEDWAWLLFFKGDSLAQVKTLTEAAPAVSAGRFSTEFRKLWGTKGVGSQIPAALKPGDIGTGIKTTQYLAVFSKGDKWSAEESESTRKLLGKHIENVVKLHKTGKLKFYGTFDDRDEPRGFAVVTAKSLKEAQSVFKNDPAVKASWLRPNYYTFEVAEGVLP
jgi:uncharacterized protein YciI